ncbi:MAG: hypothetical protein HY812_07375 [Planctomycetes bacterium]|nr:hypothetical protein [Planctomycetota bacterium]
MRIRTGHGRYLPALCLISLSACTGLEREGVDEKFNFWPLARYETVAEPPGHTLDVLWPLAQFQRAGEASASRVLPFYVHKDDGAGKRFLNALLLYWQEINEPRSKVSRTLFPFLFYVRSPEEWETHVWPLYGVRKYGPEDKRSRCDMAIFPLFDYDRRLDGSWSDLDLLGIGPVFSLFDSAYGAPKGEGEAAVARRDIDVLQLLSGLFSVFTFRQRPLLEAQALAEGEQANAQAAPTAGGFTRESRFLDLFGALALFAHRSEHDAAAQPESRRAHFFPFYWHFRDQEKSTLFLLPLFGREERGDTYTRTWIVPPLVSLEEDDAEEMSGVDVLWPLWRYESRGGSDPGWHLRALPLLWFTKRPDAQTSLILPIYYRIRDAENDYLHVVPFYGRHSEHGGLLRRTFIVPPFYIATRDEREHLTRRDFLYPLARFETSQAGTRNYALPFFYYRDAESRSHLNVLGLFDRDKSEVRVSTLCYPFYSGIEAFGEGSRTSWLPFFDWRFFSDPVPGGEDTSVLFPLASFQRKDNERSRWVFPFYWWFDDGAGETYRHIWPFFGVDHERTGLRRFSTLFPLFFYGANEEGTHKDAGVLFPLGGAATEDGESRHWFIPLFYNRTTEQGDNAGSRTWVLWPFFSRTTEADGSWQWNSLFTLLLNHEHGPGEEGAEEFSVLGALYRSRSEGEKSSTSVAFLFRYENDGGERTLKLFHLIPIRF